MKENAKNKNLGSSLVNDGQIGDQKKIFKSKYPKDYDKGPELSIKSIHTPLMGEVNFVHAKRPKHIKKQESLKPPVEKDEEG